VSKSDDSLPAFQKDLCFIDVETTGSHIGYHEIIDIGVIRTCPAAADIRCNWQRRVAPLFPGRVTAIAREINGFSVEKWPSDPPSRSFWEEFIAVVSGGVPVCHNPSFERAFISLAAADQGVLDLGLDHHWLGTESLAWPLVKSRSLAQFSLKSISEYLGLAPEPTPHSALGGAEACFRVYKQLMEIHASAQRTQKTGT
jgi:DNA polymerase III epsilon subunit-like protein